MVIAPPSRCTRRRRSPSTDSLFARQQEHEPTISNAFLSQKPGFVWLQLQSASLVHSAPCWQVQPTTTTQTGHRIVPDEPPQQYPLSEGQAASTAKQEVPQQVRVEPSWQLAVQVASSWEVENIAAGCSQASVSWA